MDFIYRILRKTAKFFKSNNARTKTIRLWFIAILIGLVASTLAALSDSFLKILFRISWGTLAIALIFFGVVIFTRLIFKQKIHRDADRALKWQSGYFFLWFWGHNILWISLACLSTWFLIEYLGPRLVVLLYSTGAIAYAVYGAYGMIRFRNPLSLGICWLRPQLDQMPDFWTWLAKFVRGLPGSIRQRDQLPNPWMHSLTTIALRERAEAVIDQLESSEISNKYSRMLDQISVMRSGREPETSSIDFTPEEKMQSIIWHELRHRFRVFSIVLLASSLMVLPCFTLYALLENILDKPPSSIAQNMLEGNGGQPGSNGSGEGSGSAREGISGGTEGEGQEGDGGSGTSGDGSGEGSAREGIGGGTEGEGQEDDGSSGTSKGGSGEGSASEGASGGSEGEGQEGDGSSGISRGGSGEGSAREGIGGGTEGEGNDGEGDESSGGQGDGEGSASQQDRQSKGDGEGDGDESSGGQGDGEGSASQQDRQSKGDGQGGKDTTISRDSDKDPNSEDEKTKTSDDEGEGKDDSTTSRDSEGGSVLEETETISDSGEQDGTDNGSGSGGGSGGGQSDNGSDGSSAPSDKGDSSDGGSSGDSSGNQSDGRSGGESESTEDDEQEEESGSSDDRDSSGDSGSDDDGSDQSDDGNDETGAGEDSGPEQDSKSTDEGDEGDSGGPGDDGGPSDQSPQPDETDPTPSFDDEDDESQTESPDTSGPVTPGEWIEVEVPPMLPEVRGATDDTNEPAEPSGESPPSACGEDCIPVEPTGESTPLRLPIQNIPNWILALLNNYSE